MKRGVVSWVSDKKTPYFGLNRELDALDNITLKEDTTWSVFVSKVSITKCVFLYKVFIYKQKIKGVLNESIRLLKSGH